VLKCGPRVFCVYHAERVPSPGAGIAGQDSGDRQRQHPAPTNRPQQTATIPGHIQRVPPTPVHRSPAPIYHMQTNRPIHHFNYVSHDNDDDGGGGGDDQMTVLLLRIVIFPDAFNLFLAIYLIILCILFSGHQTFFPPKLFVGQFSWCIFFTFQTRSC